MPFSGAGGLQGGECLQFGDGSHAFGKEHAAASQLPMLVLLQQHFRHQGVIAASLGNMRTTRVRRLISSLTRSCRFVFQTFSVGEWEVAERQHVLPGLVHPSSSFAETLC